MKDIPRKKKHAKKENSWLIWENCKYILECEKDLV